jgi:hypothetical protein
MRPAERRLSAVPLSVFAFLMMSLATQLLFNHYLPRPMLEARPLPVPPSVTIARGLSFGEEPVLARLGMLWLQSFDNQPGISLPFASLDYGRLIAWLRLILSLDPQAQYPLLSASRVYAEVPDRNKQRAILDFVETEFKRDPNLRWPWMAHAVYVAKHRMEDPQLALRYARTLATHATGREVPHWAKQMVIFVLEDMGELQSAKVLLGGLLDSGKISDPHERWFLSHRLAELEQRSATAEMQTEKESDD